MSEPEPKLFESRSRSGNKKFRLHNTVCICHWTQKCFSEVWIFVRKPIPIPPPPPPPKIILFSKPSLFMAFVVPIRHAFYDNLYFQFSFHLSSFPFRFPPLFGVERDETQFLHHSIESTIFFFSSPAWGEMDGYWGISPRQLNFVLYVPEYSNYKTDSIGV